jgi:hypothetical protein
MLTRTIPEIVDETRAALVAQERIFEHRERLTLRKAVVPEISEDDEHNKYAIFNWPKAINPDTVDGYKLIDDKGYISIREIYRFKNGKDLHLVGHVYRYCTQEMIYNSTHSESTYEKELFYKFHYDMDLLHTHPNLEINPDHAPKHLHVMHELPRFEVSNASLGLFFSSVIQLCFKKNGTDYMPRKDPFFNFAK